MPRVATAPHKAARRITRRQVRADSEAGGPAAGAEIDSHDIKDYVYSLNEIEQFCEGCDRTISPLPTYRVTRRDGRQYCLECAKRPLPTAAEMLEIIARAFDVVAAVARRGEEGYLGQQVAVYALNELHPEFECFDGEQWEHLADIWDRLAYRPLQVPSR